MNVSKTFFFHNLKTFGVARNKHASTVPFTSIRDIETSSPLFFATPQLFANFPHYRGKPPKSNQITISHVIKFHISHGSASSSDTGHHTYTLSPSHTNMAWKSVMSSTSHHALFLCSEVSEANGNSSFSPSPPTPTFILSCLPSFSPYPPLFPLWSCTNPY